MFLTARTGSDQVDRLARITIPDGLDAEHLVKHQPDMWSMSTGKRYCDIFLASLAMLLAAPFFILASVLVLTSRGPLFFASTRVGREGKHIRVLKFRTMWYRKELGVQLTRGADDRITPVGRWLRKWKLDELPQLINVLRNEMSLVGPRPDSPEFINTLPECVQATLFRIRPGITSVASLKFRDEAAVLDHIPERKLRSYYVHTLLPHKLSLDLDYASRATLFSDLRLLFRTAVTILR
jgi:lipopolysaccharide/colanic/teichoic acid biosynthesis glycosyltransferase